MFVLLVYTVGRGGFGALGACVSGTSGVDGPAPSNTKCRGM